MANKYDKTESLMHMRNLKQPLNHELVLKKLHRIIKFNQKTWLKPYTDISTDLERKTKNNFEKYFF